MVINLEPANQAETLRKDRLQFNDMIENPFLEWASNWSASYCPPLRPLGRAFLRIIPGSSGLLKEAQEIKRLSQLPKDEQEGYFVQEQVGGYALRPRFYSLRALQDPDQVKAMVSEIAQNAKKLQTSRDQY